MDWDFHKQCQNASESECWGRTRDPTLVICTPAIFPCKEITGWIDACLAMSSPCSNCICYINFLLKATVLQLPETPCCICSQWDVTGILAIYGNLLSFGIPIWKNSVAFDATLIVYISIWIWDWPHLKSFLNNIYSLGCLGRHLLTDFTGNGSLLTQKNGTPNKSTPLPRIPGQTVAFRILFVVGLVRSTSYSNAWKYNYFELIFRLLWTFATFDRLHSWI